MNTTTRRPDAGRQAFTSAHLRAIEAARAVLALVEAETQSGPGWTGVADMEAVAHRLEAIESAMRCGEVVS